MPVARSTLARIGRYRFTMPAPRAALTSRQRWVLYFVLTGLPGLNVTVWFGFGWAMVFEAFVWIPQQRLFDVLELAKTLPFQDR